MLDAKIEGLSELEAALKKVAPKIAKGALRSGLLKGARLMGIRARQNCPVVTGNLKKSIKWRGRRQRGTIVAAALMATAPHSHLVEFGTAVRYSKSGAHRGAMPPNRFMTRAMDEKWKESVEAVGIQIKKYLWKKDLR